MINDSQSNNTCNLTLMLKFLYCGFLLKFINKISPIVLLSMAWIRQFQIEHRRQLQGIDQHKMPI